MSLNENARSPLKWNPWNKVVQYQRDGTIDLALTAVARKYYGLPPYDPLVKEDNYYPVPERLAYAEMPKGHWINKKKGTSYVVTELNLCTTNAQDRQVMVEYYDLATGRKFSREVGEFTEKFRPWSPHDQVQDRQGSS